jgi:hypothetical protein
MTRWAAICASAMISAAAASQACAQAPAGPAASPRLEHYTTADTPIGALLDDPAAKAILQREVPPIVSPKAAAMVRGASLKQIQGYALQVLTDEKLAAIDAELAALPPKPVTWSTRQTVDEAKVRPYTLPDPLKLANGQPVRDAATWRGKRRPEILGMFETLEHGRAPGRPAAERFEVFDKGSPAFGGKAIRKQVMIRVSADPAAPQIQLVEYLPAAARKPVPMLLVIGFTAPSAMFDDPGVRPGLVWDAAKKQKVPATASPLGKMQVDRFLDAGIGVAAFYYGDLDPDFAGGYPLGIRAVYDKADEAHRAPDAWGSIAAWAWSLSRAQDYLATDPAVDARRVAIYGASRLGKTVLWAAARDQRFAAVIACCSGKLGAGLIRRNFGASVGEGDGGAADYWLAPNFAKYREREDDLPMDGHMLLAAIAPRPVLLQTGKYDHAADPKGEFLSEVAAGPVYRLLGAQDLGTAAWPPSGPILRDLGYSMNGGGHGPAPGDWDIYLQFLKIHLHP